MKTTLELSLNQFKQEIVHLLAQQVPMADFEEIDITDSQQLNITFKNDNTIQTVDTIIITVDIPDKPLVNETSSNESNSSS